MKQKLFGVLLLTFLFIAAFSPAVSADTDIEGGLFYELDETTLTVDVDIITNNNTDYYMVSYFSDSLSDEKFEVNTENKVKIDATDAMTFCITSYDSAGNEILTLPKTTVYTQPMVLDGITLENNVLAKEITSTEENINLNSYMLYVFEDAVIKSNFRLDNGKLHVGNDLIVSNGTLAISGGTLEVAGDFKIVDAETGGPSSGKLNMTNPDDKVCVDGDFVTDSVYAHTGYLTEGVFRLKGNLTQANTEGSYFQSHHNFDTEENFKIVFCGDDTQVVYFNDPRRSQLAAWDIENTSENPMEIPHGFGIRTLNQDSTIPCDVAIWSYLYTDRPAPPVNLNGYTLHIKGDLINRRVNMVVNHGNLVIDGDYRLQALRDDGSGQKVMKYTYGTLRMLYDDDYVFVGGDFYQDSYYSHAKCMIAGTLEIKGDFRQITTNPKDDTHYNFDASGTHKVVLSGDGLQIVDFEDPDKNQFNILEIPENDKPGHMIVFTSEWHANEIVNNSSLTALINWAESEGE